MLPAIAVSLLVGIGALVMGWLTPAAAFAVAVMGIVVIWRLGWFWAIPPVLFLGVGSLLSGGRKGKRNLFQILANGGVATLFALLGDYGAYLVALTVGFSDTVATEIGTRLSPEAYLITGFKRVPRGTSGAVSVPGTVAGLITILAMSLFLLMENAGNLSLFIASSAVGLFADSLLGATVESRGIFNNDATNFAATLVGAVLYAICTHV